MLKIDIDNGITDNNNWAYQIKLILDHIGLSNIWITQNISSTDIQMIRRRILDNYYQSWYASINNTSKLQTYCLFKHKFEFEEYLDYIKDKKTKNIFNKIKTFFP